MAVYVIGDVQGCYSSLCHLLDSIKFDPSQDRLWFCGDLVNRGPQSLQTLRFVRSLGDKAITVLGNHDLHLLAIYHLGKKTDNRDSLFQILDSADCDELMSWLQNRPLAHYESDFSTLMVHAGIHPNWQLDEALKYAGEVESVLRGEHCHRFLSSMYGDQPDYWSDGLTGNSRLRCITNVLTRMRFFDSNGKMDMDAKGGPNDHPQLTPWFKVPSRENRGVNIVFGHWSTLSVGEYNGHFATDSGCVWGGQMTALRIDSETPEWFSVRCNDGSRLPPGKA